MEIVGPKADFFCTLNVVYRLPASIEAETNGCLKSFF